jgi:hypothetical protein
MHWWSQPEPKLSIPDSLVAGEGRLVIADERGRKAWTNLV